MTNRFLRMPALAVIAGAALMVAACSQPIRDPFGVPGSID